MNTNHKIAVCEKWQAAQKLNRNSTFADFLTVFPDIATLEQFYQEAGKLSWPECYGQSPHDFAFGVASMVRYDSRVTNRCITDDCADVRIVLQYRAAASRS